MTLNLNVAEDRKSGNVIADYFEIINVLKRFCCYYFKCCLKMMVLYAETFLNYPVFWMPFNFLAATSMYDEDVLFELSGCGPLHEDTLCKG